VLVPPNRFSRHARAVAPAAAVFVTAIMAATSIDAGHIATAQGRLDAEYKATVAGLPIGHGSWIVEILDNSYTAAASGATEGLMKFLTGARGTGASRGTMAAGQLVPTNYAATIVDDRRVDEVHISLASGNVTDYTAEPPLLPLPERIPVTDADRRGVVDPMTSALARVGGSNDPVNPEACQRRVPIFDGRVRYDLSSEFKRMETVKAEKGYEGPAVVCALYFIPISGYVPDRAAIKYLVELRDAEVWLAPITGTRVLAPFYFSMPTPIGLGVLQATQFVSVAQPHTLAKTQ
jgi:hypothetical protein